MADTVNERLKALVVEYRKIKDVIEVPLDWRETVAELAEALEDGEMVAVIGFSLAIGMAYVRAHGLPEWIMQIPESSLALWTPTVGQQDPVDQNSGVPDARSRAEERERSGQDE